MVSAAAIVLFFSGAPETGASLPQPDSANMARLAAMARRRNFFIGSPCWAGAAFAGGGVLGPITG